MLHSDGNLSSASSSRASARRRGQAWWQFTSTEARRHATLAAAVLWSVAAVVAFAGTGYRSVFGPLKGADFVHFYTLGHLDASTAPTVLYDPAALHRLQTELVPESEPDHRLPVYPPHAAILFRPFATLSYGHAALLWAAVLSIVYFGCIWVSWRPFRTILRDRRLIIAAAAAFPPFWFLVLNGQSTVFPLLGFCLAWVALEHRRPFWAGAALGLLLMKPQFALVLVPLVLFCGEWAMMAGAAVATAVHVVVIVTVLGRSVLWQYVEVTLRFPQLQAALDPRPEQMHSLSGLTTALPVEWKTSLWAVLSALVILRTIQVWRSTAPVAVRAAVLVLASTLVNPHVFGYDAVVLAPALVWLAGWLYGEAHDARTTAVFSPIAYALFVLVFAPTATIFPLQASVIVLGGLFILVSNEVLHVRNCQPVTRVA
jgi:glycosyl transferase family 87